MSNPVETAADSLSVCLATFNGARFLREQIDSVLSQLRPGDEFLVADDGSSDDTVRILESYGSRLRVVATDRVGGVVDNFERVLMQARGDLIALCDQDDVWMAGRADFMRQRLRDATLLMMNGDVVDGDLRPTGQDIEQFVRFRGGFLRTLASNHYVGCCMAFRRELLGVALPFPRKILWHDWYLALVAELLFTTEFSARKTLLFRRHGANASNTGQRSRNSLSKKLRSRFWMAVAVAIAAWRFARRRSGAFT
jgi:glycosyltransferase involved in cell wall biosynthesis